MTCGRHSPWLTNVEFRPQQTHTTIERCGPDLMTIAHFTLLENGAMKGILNRSIGVVPAEICYHASIIYHFSIKRVGLGAAFIRRLSTDTN